MNQLPDDWKTHVADYLRKRTGSARDHLLAGDFPVDQSVLLRFPDGSHALFRFAFVIRDEVRGQMAVFTEHCGYHIFPLEETEVEVVRTAISKPTPLATAVSRLLG